MFHFPAFPPPPYTRSDDGNPAQPRLGSPIRTPSDNNARSPTPRGISQTATSFISSECQGIHRMPNKTKQNTKNSTEQICSQPLYKSQTTHHTHPHPNHTKPRQAMRATTTTSGGRQHGVEREPDSVLIHHNVYAQPNTHPHPPPTTGSVKM